MEAAACYQSLHFSKATDFVPRPCFLAARSSFDSKSLCSDGFVKRFCLISQNKQRERITILTNGKLRREVRASSNSSSRPLESSSELAPLQLESPVGQFLSQILVSHPHLVPAAVDQQLEQLLTELEAEKSQEESNSSGTELILYRRIAEVKAKERKNALGEILYALVVQKFVDSDVSLVSSMPKSSKEPNEVAHWPSLEEKFQSLHSPEAFEMVKNHLSVILGNRLEDSSSIASINKLRVGQVYAASILYGYFLKRMDQRFQLDKSMKTLPFGSEEERESAKGCAKEALMGAESVSSPEELSATFSPGGFADRIKPCRLRTYVMSLDSETLQRFASVRSKEAFSIFEKHTEALFERPEIVITPQGAIDYSKEELIKLSFSGLKRLILEAVTFGSFLWDVESYVDSRYHFVIS
ncbi:UV-B-induced protein At3g17800, chloroplastic-like [Phalaenopsis equestris]|uniref:UV-B-induced protein At3g17800, chloroplastic-like n=1 Tax=Phalaenopsis equestris TaxID=78828 RepID=UPI0009E47CD2|nr:UV-B-induced protein At3g17800, chloroplastic-like [Phalaenopsis equestris]